MQTNLKVWVASHPSELLIPEQLLHHYLAKFYLLNLNTESPGSLVLSINRPCFMMYLDIAGNRCQLAYHPGGLFSRTIAAGANQVMIIIFRPEWLLYRCKNYPEFKPMTAAFQGSRKEAEMLPVLGGARSLYQSFKQLAERHEVSKEQDYYLFIDNLISRYQRKMTLIEHTQQHYRRKAEAIANFITENFASDLVENLPRLAARFMVSERHLARIAKSAFGIPLHSQVIKIRMNACLKQLLYEDIPLHEVARLSGYRDTYYFSRAFKKCFQVPPSFLSQKNTAIPPS